MRHFTPSTIIYIILLLNRTVHPNPYYKIDEYFIEHDVSSEQAKRSIGNLSINEREVPAGCKPCSQHEIRYCLGSQLINDHCCCDRRYQEFFPFIPHTCYIGEKLCRPIVKDCAEYTRLRTCCCDRYTLELWKTRSTGVSSSPGWMVGLTLLVLGWR